MGLENKIAALSDAYSSIADSAAVERLNMLFDEGSFVRLDSLSGSTGIITGFGTIEGVSAYAFAQNPESDGGAVSVSLTSKLHKLFDMALNTGYPVIGIFDSDGAKLKEGNLLFNFYGELLNRTSRLSGVVPQVSLVLGTCVGISALAASAADVVIATSGVSFGIETNGNNSTVADSAKTGDIHIVTENDAEAIAKCRALISMLPSNNLESVPVVGYDEQDVGDILANNMNLVGTNERITRSIIAAVTDSESFIELSKDFGTTTITGFATVSGESVGVVATRYRRNGGKMDADGATKAARFVRFCDAYSVPVITLADCAGFDSLRDAAKLASAYSEATTVKLTVITGAAYGSAFVALSNADYTVAWPSAVITPLAPETACAVLYNERVAKSQNPVAERAAITDEYKDGAASPITAAADGIIDDVIMPSQTREKLIAALEALASKRVATLPKKHSNIQL